MISTKGRYALRVLVDLAEHGEDGLVTLRAVAGRQGISEKYLQHIAKLLVDAGIIAGVSGKGGGYRLARPAGRITALEALEATEGTMAQVACLQAGAEPCERMQTCKTLPLWQRFDAMVRDLFGSATIQDLVDGNV